MGTITGAIIAFVAGLGLAGATVAGVVHSQHNSATKPITTSAVSYGTNK